MKKAPKKRQRERKNRVFPVWNQKTRSENKIGSRFYFLNFASLLNRGYAGLRIDFVQFFDHDVRICVNIDL